MQIKKIDQKLHEQAKIEPHETIYRSAPGIGPLSARILSNELGELSQFANERQLFSLRMSSWWHSYGYDHE
jgi:transposase